MAGLLEKLSSQFNSFIARSSTVTKSLVAIGLLWSTQHAFSILSFTYLHFLRRSSLQKYITTSSDNTKQAWALVTGSSDGIGKGFAEELCSRGVNVVIHGRSMEKLEKVKDDLLRQWPARKVRILVLNASDAASEEAKLNEVAKSFQDINLRILINNVGGDMPIMAPLVERSYSEVRSTINIVARFHAEITRVLLPQLIKNHSSLIINIGSPISDLACPYMEVYAGSKAFIKSWSRCLGAELEAEGNDIEVFHCQVGQVSTNTVRKDVGFLVPSARQFAKSALAKVGCGRDVVWAYWPHALQFGVFGVIPQVVLRRLMISMSKAMIEKERQKKVK